MMLVVVSGVSLMSALLSQSLVQRQMQATCATMAFECLGRSSETSALPMKVTERIDETQTFENFFLTF